MIFNKAGVVPDVSYIRSFPSHDAVTRYLPVGSHEAERTGLAVSARVVTRSVSPTWMILTIRSLAVSPLACWLATYSAQTATRSPDGSTETQRIGTPEDRVRKPVYSF